MDVAFIDQRAVPKVKISQLSRIHMARTPPDSIIVELRIPDGEKSLYRSRERKEEKTHLAVGGGRRSKDCHGNILLCSLSGSDVNVCRMSRECFFASEEMDHAICCIINCLCSISAPISYYLTTV